MTVGAGWPERASPGARREAVPPRHLRIVQVCPYNWDARGGVQAHVAQFTRQLQVQGHSVTIVAPGIRPRDPASGVHIIGRPTCVPFNGSVAPTCLDLRLRSPIERMLSAVRPDIVHVHEPYASVLCWFAALEARSPVVATFHASIERPFDRRLYAMSARLLWSVRRRLALQIAVSEAAARTAVLGTRRPLTVVPNGTELDRIKSAVPAALDGAGCCLLFVGRLDERKGLGIALEAFSHLIEDTRDLRLVIVGDGPERSRIDRLPQRVRARVTAVGACSRRELLSLYAAADVFVAPATGRESFGMVVLDALAAGLPVVASDIAGYRELIQDGREGLLVPPGDARALAAAIRRLIDDSTLVRRMVASGSERATAFAWTVLAPQVEALYDRAILSAKAAKERPGGAAARRIA